MTRNVEDMPEIDDWRPGDYRPAVGALLSCRRCGRIEALDHPTGDQFFCCGEKMKKESC